MLKNIVRSSAIALALTLLAVPVKQANAQAPVVTGTNPMPTGESEVALMILAGSLSTI